MGPASGARRDRPGGRPSALHRDRELAQAYPPPGIAGRISPQVEEGALSPLLSERPGDRVGRRGDPHRMGRTNQSDPLRTVYGNSAPANPMHAGNGPRCKNG